MMSGSALFALAWLRNELIRLRFQEASPGPATGVTRVERADPLDGADPAVVPRPAAAVFHVQSGSFHISQAWMLLTVVAASRARTMVSTLASQSFQLTQRYGKSG